MALRGRPAAVQGALAATICQRARRAGIAPWGAAPNTHRTDPRSAGGCLPSWQRLAPGSPCMTAALSGGWDAITPARRVELQLRAGV